ncbi:MATE family efflux transporter [Shewanella pneumatophori]|uniref:Multidrug export protein MepA n=2 Tax=Shewanella pneumatophori TaxID=314092 RepID=A0A9X1ZEM8_9GAMM|nr:MATE family efflux transporter [Shewanella pneumatophori]MCL1138487.1 MATE family efflux transporter [Shewanella pneumatophori]
MSEIVLTQAVAGRKASESPMVTEPINKLFWRYSIPTILSMLVTGIYVTIDGMFIGHYLGEVGLAGMILAYPIAAILYAIGATLGMGGAALVSIHQGQGEPHIARKILGNTFSLCLIFGVITTVIGCYFSRDILLLLGAEGEILSSADDYLFWYFALGTFPIVSMAFTALLRNDGRPGFVTFVLILGGVLNTILDWLLIVVFPYGLMGAAIATMISQAITGALCLQHFFSNRTELGINLEQMKLKLDHCINIIRVGIPSFLMNMYLTVVLTLHNVAFLKVGTPIHVAAYSVVSYTEAFFYLLFEGIAFGVQPILSFNAGAKRFDRVKQTLKLAFSVTLICAALGLVFIYSVPQLFVYIFAGDNTLLTPIATEGMRWYFWGLPMEGMLLIGASFFQAINYSKEASILTGAKLILFSAILYVFAWAFGVTGVWISLATCSTILVVWMAWVMKRTNSKLMA